MKSKYSQFFSLLALLLVLPLSAHAEFICRVTDPTGTPLNVRNKPNGKVVSTVKNGTRVEIIGIDYDDKERAWARISAFRNGDWIILGWVIREFVSCYED